MKVTARSVLLSSWKQRLIIQPVRLPMCAVISINMAAHWVQAAALNSMFDHKCVFHINKKDGISLEDLELELIDYGVDEVDEDEEEVVIYGEFAQNSAIQKYLEENGYEITSSEFVRIPNDLKEVTAEQRETLDKLIEKLEEDDDVQNVFHNMKEDESGEE